MGDGVLFEGENHGDNDGEHVTIVEPSDEWTNFRKKYCSQYV